MADQENPETTETAAAAPADEPATPEEAAPEAAAAEEAAPEAPAPEEPAAAEEAAPAEEPAVAEEAAPAAEAAAPAAPAAPQAPPATPKERKAASRARRGTRRPATPEDRAELRAQKAQARSRRRASEKAKRVAKGEGTPPAEHDTAGPKTRLGKVISDKADKTITVRIDVARRHRRYQKIVRSSTTLHAHDEANDAHEGDLVRVVESRPMSATKRWRLVEVLERAK
jgi:small subunit ribosomal protein S17